MKIRKLLLGTILMVALFVAYPPLESVRAYSPDITFIGLGRGLQATSGENDSSNAGNTEEMEPEVSIQGPETESEISGQRPEEEDWKLILVNRWNPIPENYEITFTELQNDHRVDSRIYPELQAMFDDARAQGILPMISSSYRTTEMQQQLMDEKIAEYQGQGYGCEDARALAEQWVAIPGTSEHQIGIAVDITTADWQRQDASIVWDWLNNNCYKYGFILRYPEDKTEITGVMGEPWHYRYVGKEAAREIYEMGVCLEEYLGRVSG